ncbi:hypothetical protein B0H21DRAFT_741070 [Amylocystis lapponica]|nr:hypothetical protein B0H21DRAFT_741070 [Amylocystis lapponica]
MAPSHLQGLNILQPPPPQNPYLSDADLLSVPPFHDLNAQLDLWTNLNFQSDEPLTSRHGDSAKSRKFDGQVKPGEGSEEEERYNDQDDDLQMRGGVAEANAHENVVTGTVLPPTGVAHNAHTGAPSSVNTSGMSMNSLDINSILAGFGIDPFLVPPVQSPPSSANANSIAQLLSLHAATFRSPPLGTVPSASSPAQSPESSAQSTPAPKRVRTSRGSISSIDTSQLEGTPGPESDDKLSATPFTAAEDKRRRNTAASARFRLKKKEREAALERKAKELEVRVGELEKECEALRRENGWLKGLVVGVTGAGAVQQAGTSTGAPTGTKRIRDDVDSSGGDGDGR